MKHIKLYEEYLNEGNQQFEDDYERFVVEIERGYGWIDPDYVEETWAMTPAFTPFNKVKDEVLKRLISDGILYFSKDNDPEEKGKKITNISQIK